MEGLEKVIPLLAGVSMDIKTSFDKYNDLIRVQGGSCVENVKKSILLLVSVQSMMKVEFRTTVFDPMCNASDVAIVASFLKGLGFNGYYAIQQYDPERVERNDARFLKVIKSDDVIAIARSISGLGFRTFARTRDQGIVETFKS